MKTRKQTSKQANEPTSKVTNINKQTNKQENLKIRKKDITNKQANSKPNCEVNIISNQRSR